MDIEKMAERQAEEREKILKEYLANDEKFMKFLKENYILITMDDVTEENGKIEYEEVVCPMRKEEWKEIKKSKHLVKELQKQMKEKLEEEDA